MKPKRLANGFAIAAALAIASQAWAQGTPPAAGAGMQGANPTTIPTHHAVRHAHAMHAHHMRMSEEAHAAGDTTAALNRQELARVQSGQPPVPPSAPMGEGPPGSPQPPPSH